MKKRIVFIGILILLGLFCCLLAEGPIASLVFVFAILYMVISTFFVSCGVKKTEVRIITEQKEEANQATIVLNNTGNFPVMNCLLAVKAHNLITGKMDCCKWNLSLGPKGHREIQMEVKDHCCGGILLEIEQMVIGDFFHFIKKRIQVKREDLVYILPKLKELSVNKEDVGRYDMESHRFSPYKKGNDSSETFGISEYRPGDSVKYIHWKLSGKLDQPMVRELGLPIDHKIMILVEKAIGGQEFDGEKNSQATELAVGISFTFVKGNVPHVLGWYNYRKNLFESYTINGEDDLWTCIPHLLASPYKRSEHTVISSFIESDTEKDYSRFVIVANQNIEIERLMHYGEVDLYTPEDFDQL